MNIDQSTGLPVLPDGQFWRIQNARDAFGPNFVTVQIVQNMSIMREEAVRFFGIWFGKFKLIPETKEVVVASSAVWDPRKEFSRDEVEKEGRVFIVENPNGKFYPFLNPQDLTADRIRDTAEFILEKKRRTDEANSLLGDYPPKTILANSEES